ncbi:MAG: beta-ketoacyl synthase chain length factor, partial [Bacteroidales bacterium]|nr:beta-ketoacyl synthase chain length factor [Bacteroidales bacterium]
MGIYIQSAAQISAQKPLCWDFLSEPIIYQEKLVHSLMPDTKAYIPSNEARRMDNILKRAVVTAKSAIETANISQPDAIIAGTGLGCMDNTLHFLQDMTQYNEEMLSPTFFMKSTHNTLASQLACLLHCHGYNTTYAHGEISFESALLDTLMQFQLQNIHTALVGAYDEMPNIYFEWLEKLNHYKK